MGQARAEERLLLTDLTETLARIQEVQSLTLFSLGYRRSERRAVVGTLATNLYRTGLLKHTARQIHVLVPPERFEQIVWDILCHIPYEHILATTSLRREKEKKDQYAVTDVPTARVSTVPPDERTHHARRGTGRDTARTRRYPSRVGERLTRAVSEYRMPA